MSGGIAYVLDLDGDFKRRCNLGMVDIERLDQPEEIALVRELIQRHAEYTGSTYAAGILRDWIDMQPRLVKIMPRDYKRVLLAEAQARAEGRPPTFAELVGTSGG
jgi:glutamate synthase (ferredoxin)